VKTTLTAKLKPLTTPDQFRALRATQLAYRAALNHVSAYSFAHGKTSNRKRLQTATYADIRTQFGLPAQMACNVPRQVGSTYRTLWTKAKKNAEARRLGSTRRPSRDWIRRPTTCPRRSPTTWAVINPYGQGKR
jgi:predicted transposase